MADPVRLPHPGGDAGDWGKLLNNFLDVEHNADGSLKKAGIIASAEQTANKNQPGGYVGMTEDGVVDAQYLPTFHVGEYLGVLMYSQTITSGIRVVAVFDTTTDSLGSSLTWTADDPTRVIPQLEGVYSVSVTVNWQDSAASSSSRFVQIYSQCQFHTEDQRVSTTGTDTIQSVSMTMTLRQLQDVQLYLEQVSDIDVTPQVLVLVTRIAHTSLPI